jgi:hypothetical protein
MIDYDFFICSYTNYNLWSFFEKRFVTQIFISLWFHYDLSSPVVLVSVISCLVKLNRVVHVFLTSSVLSTLFLSLFATLYIFLLCERCFFLWLQTVYFVFNLVWYRISIDSCVIRFIFWIVWFNCCKLCFWSLLSLVTPLCLWYIFESCDSLCC